MVLLISYLPEFMRVPYYIYKVKMLFLLKDLAL